MKRLVSIGASGMVGGYALRYALAHAKSNAGCLWPIRIAIRIRTVRPQDKVTFHATYLAVPTL